MSEQTLALLALALVGALPAAFLVYLGRGAWWLLGGLGATLLAGVAAMSLWPSNWGVLGWVVVIAVAPILIGALAGAGAAVLWKRMRNG